MRSITSALAVLLTTAGIAACGSVSIDTDKIDDDVQQLRDQADDAIRDVQDGAPASELRQELRKIRRDLREEDLDGQAREKLEQARDALRDALR